MGHSCWLFTGTLKEREGYDNSSNDSGSCYKINLNWIGKTIRHEILNIFLFFEYMMTRSGNFLSGLNLIRASH